MFSLPGESNNPVTLTQTQALEAQLESNKKGILGDISEKNSRIFDEQIEKLDKWASDKKNGLKIKLKELDEEIENLKKEARYSPNLQEKLQKQKQIRGLEKKRDETWKTYDADAQEINKKRDQLIDEIESRMEQKITINKVFSIKWRLT